MAALESRPPRVLLVDDVPANLLALRAVLAPIGAELVEAHRYRDAFKGGQIVGVPIVELGVTAEVIGLLDLVAVSGDTFSLTECTMKLPSRSSANEE
jgi:CheY-like chemotaxis protein